MSTYPLTRLTSVIPSHKPHTRTKRCEPKKTVLLTKCPHTKKEAQRLLSSILMLILSINIRHASLYSTPTSPIPQKRRICYICYHYCVQFIKFPYIFHTNSYSVCVWKMLIWCKKVMIKYTHPTARFIELYFIIICRMLRVISCLTKCVWRE